MLTVLLVACEQSPRTPTNPENLPGTVYQPTEEPPKEQTAAERDTVLARIARLDLEPFYEAHDKLPQYRFTRYSRTDQFNEETLIAYIEREVQHRGTPEDRTYEIIEADSAGQFDFGYFTRFVSLASPSVEPPKDLGRSLVPQDPSYLAPRNFDGYYYRVRGDTLLWHTTAHSVEVISRQGVAGKDNNIRRARFYYNPTTFTLLAFYLERLDKAALYEEQSHFYMQIQEDDRTGELLPVNTRFETINKTPFQPERRFRTVTSYYDYR